MVSSISFAAAFAGGLISFASPCVLPVVPGYLTVITGVDIGGAATDQGRSRRIVRETSLFIGGFSLVFILLGLTATSLGQTLVSNLTLLTRISGVVILAMGLYLIGSLIARAPWLYGEKRYHPDLQRFGPFASPVAGVAFGFGWTPCIGPILTAILAIAAVQDRVWEGAALLGVYSLGLGIPFMVTGLAFGRLAGAFTFVKNHLRGITLASAFSLTGFGLLLSFDQLTWITTQLQEAMRAVGLDILVELG